MKLGTDMFTTQLCRLAGTRASLGAADLETLKFTSFQGKISPLLSLTTRLPISCSFNPNETWHRHSHITSLQPSYVGLLAQELVWEQQT